MKKNILFKIICIIAILFVLFCSGRLAFAQSVDINSYDVIFPNAIGNGNYSLVKYNNVPEGLSRIGCVYNNDGTTKMTFLFYNSDFKLVSSSNYSLFQGMYNPSGDYFPSSGTYDTPPSLIFQNGYTANIPIADFSSLGSKSGYQSLIGIDCRSYVVSGGGLDFISGNNYDKNDMTNFSSDIFYPVPMGITYYNDLSDTINYDKFRMSFDLKPDNCRYSNITNYDLELWVLDTDRRIYVKSFPLASLQSQPHSGGSSWGDSDNNIYYVLEGKLHDLISFVDELGSPLTLEFRLLYRINDTSYLESGYVDVNLDLITGKVNSVNYYPDGMDESGTGNENQIIVPEIVYPSSPNQYVFNIDWDNSNLDEYVKNNFGIKNYIIALKDNLSFIPEFFWTMQFYLLGVISAIGIYRLVIK